MYHKCVTAQGGVGGGVNIRAASLRSLGEGGNIGSKIGIIERLTQERININERLDRLARAKADQLDGLDYTRFNINVYENKFVDGEQLKDSWKQALRDFVANLNQVLQDVTVNLVLLVLLLAQWLLYALIVLFVAKYGWKIGKNIWFR